MTRFAVIVFFLNFVVASGYLLLFNDLQLYTRCYFFFSRWWRFCNSSSIVSLFITLVIIIFLVPFWRNLVSLPWSVFSAMAVRWFIASYVKSPSVLFLVDVSRTAQVRRWYFLHVDSSRMAVGLKKSWLVETAAFLTFLSPTWKSDRSMAYCSLIYKRRCFWAVVGNLATVLPPCLLIILRPHDFVVTATRSLMLKSILRFRIQKRFAAWELREKEHRDQSLAIGNGNLHF